MIKVPSYETALKRWELANSQNATVPMSDLKPGERFYTDHGSVQTFLRRNERGEFVVLHHCRYPEIPDYKAEYHAYQATVLVAPTRARKKKRSNGKA